MRLRPIFLSLLACSLLAAGCASVSVRPGEASSSQAKALPPQKILVSNFSFEGAQVDADRTGADLAAFKKQVADDLNAALCASLGKLGLPVDKSDASNASARRPAWLVRGRFVRVSQGSRAMRMFIGFGAGKTKMDTAVDVYDLSVSATAPAFTFTTTGGSGASPGAVLSGNAVDMGVSAAEGAAPGVSDDSRRTARMISAYLSQKLAARGYISADKAKKAKIQASDTAD